jgi:hypothetical protein
MKSNPITSTWSAAILSTLMFSAGLSNADDEVAALTQTPNVSPPITRETSAKVRVNHSNIIPC